jgi:hypothetical protein
MEWRSGQTQRRRRSRNRGTPQRAYPLRIEMTVAVLQQSRALQQLSKFGVVSVGPERGKDSQLK